MRILRSADGAETMTFSQMERMKKDGRIVDVKYHKTHQYDQDEKVELYTITFQGGQTNVYYVEEGDPPDDEPIRVVR